MSTLKTGKVKTTTIADELDTESTAVTNVINGTAKAWVNLNGTGTVAIRRAFNVSSITDSATGIYQVNFTNEMVDANYATFVNCDFDGFFWTTAGVQTTSKTNINVFNGSAYFDRSYVYVSVFS